MKNYTAYSSSSNEVESCILDRYIYIYIYRYIKNIRNVRKRKYVEKTVGILEGC